MSNNDELNVSRYITEQIKIKFNDKKYILGNWGEVDNWMEINDNVYLFIEVETKQKHPNTNVLKLWPYLEENPNKKIFLIQTFFPISPGLNSNRGRLGEWTAAKMKKHFPNRFDYSKLIIDGIDDKIELVKILTKINQFQR